MKMSEEGIEDQLQQFFFVCSTNARGTFIQRGPRKNINFLEQFRVPEILITAATRRYFNTQTMHGRSAMSAKKGPRYGSVEKLRARCRWHARCILDVPCL
jgi:hypothetical protein